MSMVGEPKVIYPINEQNEDFFEIACLLYVHVVRVVFFDNLTKGDLRLFFARPSVARSPHTCDRACGATRGRRRVTTGCSLSRCRKRQRCMHQGEQL